MIENRGNSTSLIFLAKFLSVLTADAKSPLTAFTFYQISAVWFYVIFSHFLGAYCSSTNNKSDTKALTEESITEVIYINKPVFYLDGFEGESTKTLRAAGYEDSDLYTANLFENTAAVLKVFNSWLFSLFSSLEMTFTLSHQNVKLVN